MSSQPGRLPFYQIEIDYEGCTLDYGVGACTAAIGVTGSRKCYNTYATCQAKAAFDAVTKTLVLLPISHAASPITPGIPLVSEWTPAPTRIDRSAGLGPRETVTIQCVDTRHNDAGLDPYPATRGHDPLLTSTFWPKFLARAPYLRGRSLRIKTGYLTAPGAVPSGLDTLTYVIDRVDGPDASGKVSIVAKDLLSVADDKVKLPVSVAWKLDAAITNVATTATLADDSYAADDADTGVVTIDDEVCIFTRSGATLTLITRAQAGTVAATHDADAKAQPLYRIYGTIYDVLSDLLQAAGVPLAQLDVAGWQTEIEDWLPPSVLDGYVREPTDAPTLIKRICQETGTFIWWDARLAKVRLGLVRPALSDQITTLTSVDHIIETRLQVTRDPARRVSECWVHYAPITPSKAAAKPSEFKNAYIAADLVSSDPDGPTWRSAAQQVVLCPDVVDGSLPVALAARTAYAFAAPPYRVTFRLDAKDRALWVGDYVSMEHRSWVDDLGNSKPRVLQLIESRLIDDGHQVEHLAESTEFSGRFGVITDNAAPDYSASVIDPSGYISTNDPIPVMPNGDDAYLIA